MGRFKHEAAACDPDRQVVYLTEDEPDGCFYRFLPIPLGRPDDGPPGGALRLVRHRRGDLAAGAQSGRVAGGDPPPGRRRPGTSTAARAAWYAEGRLFFTTKGDNRVWAYDAATSHLEIVYDADSPLTGVDNITGTLPATSTSPRTAATWRST